MTKKATEAETVYRYFVVQTEGFNAGYIVDGPFATPMKAIKAKNRVEREAPAHAPLEVVDDPDHERAI
jgi:hypothetical protein